MPIYNYLCPKGHTTETTQPLGTKEISCPCGKKAKRIIVGVPSVRFKGEHFTRHAA